MLDFSPFIIALFVSLSLTPVARALGSRLGVLDAPGELSIHTHAIPRTGGLAMGAGFLVAIGYAWATGLLVKQGRPFLGILIGGMVIFLAGLFDDIKWISPRQKFLGQLLAAGIAIGFGLQVRTFPLVGVGIFLAFFYLVGGANALNLLDGMDGLATGTAGIAAFFLAILAAGQENVQALVLALAILGATLGFLPYNLPNADCGMNRMRNTQGVPEWGMRNGARPISNSAIFMGDSGSLFLGFVLSSIAVLLADRPYDIVGFVAPLVVIAVPILDTALAILRRVSRAGGPFSGDRQHVYDLLAGTGLGNGRAVLVIYLATALLGILSLLISRLAPIPAVLTAMAIVMIMSLVAIRLGAVGLQLPGSTK